MKFMKVLESEKEHCDVSVKVHQQYVNGPVYLRVGKKYHGEGSKEQVSRAWYDPGEFNEFLKEVSEAISNG